jgi:hypothetical protein
LSSGNRATQQNKERENTNGDPHRASTMHTH